MITSEGQYVVRFQDNFAHFVEVKKGLQSNAMTEVFGALHDGDKIILYPREDLKDGASLER